MPWMEAALALLLPRTCPGCGRTAGAEGAGICTDCRRRCGSRLQSVEAPRLVDAAWSLGIYGGPLGALVRQAKFRGDLALTDAIGDWLAAAACGLGPVDCVVPVQAQWWRVLGRGQDVPVRLGRLVARALDVPLVCGLRRTGTGTQVGRSRAERRAHIAGHYHATCVVSPRVLLVDDVLTTGATAATCAGVIRRAGATWVGLLTPVVRAWENVKKP